MTDIKQKMIQKGSWCGSLWKFSFPKSMEIEISNAQTFLTIKDSSSNNSIIDLRAIKSINVFPYFIWASIAISTGDRTETIHGLPRWKIGRLVVQLEGLVVAYIERIASSHSDAIVQFANETNALLIGNFFVRYSHVAELRGRTLAYLKTHHVELDSLIKNNFFKNTKLGKDLKSNVEMLKNSLAKDSAVFTVRNEQFIKSEIIACGSFFQGLKGSRLTEEQKASVIAFEDRNLLVAAAGSGKSSTLIGKVGYALYKNMYEPSQIIALAFNREAAQELNVRINKQLKPFLNGVKIKARTFHALGAYIIKKVSRENGKRRSVANPNKFEYRIEQAITTCLEIPQFRQSWIKFLILARDSIPDVETFKSEEDYKKYIELMRATRKNGEPARFAAISSDLVRSYEEVSICNWLYANGIAFKYEKQFPYIPDSWNNFQPDFYYPDIDVYHEHFGLNHDGKAPHFNNNYAQQAENKRALFEETIPGQWFETRSANFRDGSIFELLEERLRSHGQTFRPRSLEELEQRIADLKHEAPITDIARIVELIKSSGVTKEYYGDLIRGVDSPIRTSAFIEIIWPILEEYNRRLLCDGKIDFSDMINLAAEYIKDGSFASEFKFVLVDEYQDLSQGRARLIKAILAQHSDSVLFGVGDDWQAINGFAGSDLDLFMNFEKHFGPTYEGYLTNTFRSAQGISDVAAWFVQENERGQKQKVVHSKTDTNTQNVVDLVGFRKDEEIVSTIEEQLDRILVDDCDQEKIKTVYILGRYGIDNIFGIDKSNIDFLNRKYRNKFSIEFLTIHKSKGLEADFVFIVGLNGGRSFSFPSTMTTDPLVTALLSKADTFPFAEERRLFYVALTRAKKKVIALFKLSRPSPFVLSLTHGKYKGRVTVNGALPPKICLKCNEGFMMSKQGENGPFLSCSNYPRCKHNKSLTRKITRSFRR
jgi:DNA helicase IV